MSTLEGTMKDLTYAFRTLLRSPGFMLAAVLILSLGIGANGTVFSIVYNTLVRPLPFADPDRLVMIWGVNPAEGVDGSQVSPIDLADLAGQAASFERISAIKPRTFNLKTDGEAERVSGAQVSATFFPLLGAEPYLGRDFLPEEAVEGAHGSAILSYDLWRRRFGSDRHVLGSSLVLYGETVTIVGVAPPDLRFIKPVFGGHVEADLWMPLRYHPSEPRQRRWVFALGRLKPGVTLATAQTEMNGISRRLAAAYPETNANWGVRLEPLEEAVSGKIRGSLLIVFATVGFVLLIACVNVASLLLARAAARSSEVAVRAALGASRWRLVRQTLAEGLALSLLGALGGLLLTLLAIRLLLRLQPPEIPRLDQLNVGPPVLAFTLLLVLVITLILGLVPLLQASRSDLFGTLNESGRTSEGRGRRRTRSLLVVAEVAIALVLLTGAGLMLQTYRKLRSVDPGFRAEGVVTLSTVPRYEYDQPGEVNAYIAQVLTRLRALPGVESAAEINFLPFSGNDGESSVEILGRARAKGDEVPFHFRAASPGYLETLRIPILQGRSLLESDLTNQRVALVNEAAARQFWPDRSPLGAQVRLEPDEPWLTVAGVVGDVRHSRASEPPAPEIYVPYTLDGFSTRTFVLRGGTVDPATLMKQAQAAMREVNPSLPAFDVDEVENIFGNSLARERLVMLVLLVLATIGLVLAAIGVYGLTAFSLAQRRQELGIRMALGARLQDVYSMLLRDEGGMILLGVGVGLVGASLLTGFLRGLLFGVGSRDPVTFLLGSMTLVTAAFLAISFAMVRSRFDPAIVVRQ